VRRKDQYCATLPTVLLPSKFSYDNFTEEQRQSGNLRIATDYHALNRLVRVSAQLEF